MQKNRKKRIIKVSVGTSAFNEEKNIVKVIYDILNQSENGWKLSELIIHCDNPTDNTFNLVRAISDKRIKVYKSSERYGKVYHVNKMIKTFKGDVLIIFDADIIFSGKNIISDIVKEFYFKNVGLVCGNCRVIPKNNFFEKAIYTSYAVYYEAREKLKGGHNVFGCTGACIAVSSDLASKVTIPPDVMSEDTYLYFSCLKKGFKFRHAKKALVFHKLAGNPKDFIRQMLRAHPEAVFLGYKKYFGGLINKEYKRPLGFYIKSIFKVFLRNPVGTLYMIGLRLLCKPLFFIFSNKYKLSWYTAISTK